MADNKLLGAGGLYFGSNEIGKAYLGSSLIWEKAGEAGQDYSKEYFCIEAIEYCVITFAPQATTENGHIFSYIIFENAAYNRPPMDYLFQRFYDGDCDVFNPYSDSQLFISLDEGDIVYMIGNMDKGVSKYNSSLKNAFTFSGRVNLSGNIMSLTHGIHRNTLDITPPVDLPEKNFTNNAQGELGRLFKNQPVVDAGNLVLSSSILHVYTCWEMFYGCTSLTTAPKLQATTLGQNSYRNMFTRCTSLTTAPELSATTLASTCCRGMFSECTSLTTAPSILPATTLGQNSYFQMFYGCTSLVTAPELPATTLALNCYSEMFRGCTSLVTAPELPATTLVSSCYSSMFNGCTSLVTAPELPATTLVSSCYSSMFRDCTSLVTAPELPATTLVSSCYNFMFRDCTKLNYIKAMFTTTPTTSYTRDWVNGVSATGTFVKNSTAEWTDTGTYAVPSGWTVQTASS